ncbi:MAG: Ig-like domain-containing protein [Ignavibacteriales bacterium]|nr:Ig-like domain-containing protein [Ignavibacteriales bacterium]
MKFLYKLLFIKFVLISSLFAQVTGLSGWNIFLDPGHSQNENMGVYNLSEAKKNLRVAIYLRDLLLNTTDIDTVYLSRTNDQESVGLSQRSSLANQLNTQWYHSIHSDAGDPNSTNTLLLWGMYYNGTEKVPNGGMAMSDIMVKLLTDAMRCKTSGSIGDCHFYGACTQDWIGPYLHVNRETIMPSELSEAGYHTNPGQNQLNMNAEYKKLQAYSLYWSILDYHKIARPQVGICAGIISDLESGLAINGAVIKIGDKIYTTDTYESVFKNYSNDPTQLRNGFYFVESLPNDSVLVEVQADGYINSSTKVYIKNDFFTFKDIKLVSFTPPVVLSVIPAADSIYPGKDNIIIQFSRPMNTSSVESSLTMQPSGFISFVWSDGDKKLTIKTDSLKYNLNYSFTVSGNSTDKYDHPFDGNIDGIGGDDFSFSVTTKVQDSFPPVIIDVRPASTDMEIEAQPIISVSFNEPLSTAGLSGKIKIVKSSDQSTVAGVLKYFVVGEKSVLQFFPTSELLRGEAYEIIVSPNVSDVYGNEIQSESKFIFKPAWYFMGSTIIENFDGAFLTNWWQPQQSGTTSGILTSETNFNADKKIFNYVTKSTQSMCFNYGWDTSANEWIIREYLSGGTPKSVQFDSFGNFLQVYVFGDGNGNKVRFCVNDNVGGATSTYEVSKWYKVDWIGWKLIQWNLTQDSLGTWIGNGSLDGKLRFDSFQMTYTPGSTNTGTYYFDDLRIVKKAWTGVDDNELALPSKFLLKQNYPNPFNPTTIIRYQLPENSFITLKIFDVLGREVSTLVEGNKQAGSYSISFEANSLPSGIYIYQLKAEKFSDSKKMLLIR